MVLVTVSASNVIEAVTAVAMRKIRGARIATVVPLTEVTETDTAVVVEMETDADHIEMMTTAAAQDLPEMTDTTDQAHVARTIAETGIGMTDDAPEAVEKSQKLKAKHQSPNSMKMSATAELFSFSS